ncbi:stellacyanin-like [Panicum miliaceum]|uniref:Stellacyanin-like n=1 Tax=Panicum miliaceum TaxID=4540 RepID=A0A3L6T646_PANMI|nr:stellacyanin-like [Panicum miliaceum]
MASERRLLIVAVVVVLAAAPALAADLVVGDDKGWDLEVDYDAWVDGNQFFVGDTLVFRYTEGNHSVVEATAAGFAACSDANSLARWSSGDDRVPLSASGQRWFFSGVGEDCVQGMRFNVTVLPVVKLSPAPTSPPPPSSAPCSGGGVAPALAAAAVAAAALLF